MKHMPERAFRSGFLLFSRKTSVYQHVARMPHQLQYLDFGTYEHILTLKK